MAVRMMAEKRFWRLIDRSRAAVDAGKVKDGDEFHECQCDELANLLRPLSNRDIIFFDKRRSGLFWSAYRWDLWGAAFWLGGGCDDEDFDDVTGVLISLGRETFEKVLADPEELANLVGRKDVPDLQSRRFNSIPNHVYAEKTGDDIDYDIEYPQGPDDPVGEKFDMMDPEEIRKRHPHLFAKFPKLGLAASKPK